MRWRNPAREAGDSEIKAAPPEMDRAGLAEKAGAKSFEHRKHCREATAKAVGRVAVIVARCLVLRKGNRALDFVGHAIEVRRQTVVPEHPYQASVQGGDAARVE